MRSAYSDLDCVHHHHTDISSTDEADVSDDRTCIIRAIFILRSISLSPSLHMREIMRKRCIREARKSCLDDRVAAQSGEEWTRVWGSGSGRVA